MKFLNRPKDMIFYEFLLYSCAFVLLLEWLLPLQESLEIEPIIPILLYSIVCFGISFLRLHVALGIGLKFIASYCFVYAVYYASDYSLFDWIPSFIEEFTYNIQVLVGGQWDDMTLLFRILLVTMLIWLISYLLHYWFVQMKRIFVFFVVTILYVSVFHVFQPYDASLAIIRIIIVGIISFSLANVLKITEQEAVPLPKLKEMKGIYIAVISAIGITFIAGFFAPVQEAQWPDPMPKITDSIERLTGLELKEQEVGKVGYSEDDSELGGSFEQDDTQQFLALAQEEQYWKIETKDIYSGKGWEVSANHYTEWQDGTAIRFFEEERDVLYEERESTFLYSDLTDISRLIYPYWLTKVKTEKSLSLNPDKVHETALLEIDNSIESRVRYTTVYQTPSYSIDSLKQTTMQDIQADSQGSNYTQLPESVPSRVYDLAEEITAPYDNVYDKVVAVERYFGANGFQYDTKNVPKPDEQEDYVDQFLFDTKRGYCDNYSTSMVVLLRTLGIEARWAKGFTAGEEVDKETIDDENYRIFEVTSNNAHSWVEVYFPGSGWVPFEPTQGFSNFADFENETRSDDQVDEEKEDEVEEADKEKEKQQEDKQMDKNTSPSEKAITFSNWMVYPLVIAIILLIGLALYMKRDKIRIRYYSRLLHHDGSNEAIDKSFLFLMNLLKRRNEAKRSGETLREYAVRIDKKYEMTAMTELIDRYEQYLYSNQKDILSNQSFYSLWYAIIEQIDA